jgi:hypothetical protein
VGQYIRTRFYVTADKAKKYGPFPALLSLSQDIVSLEGCSFSDEIEKQGRMNFGQQMKVDTY